MLLAHINDTKDKPLERGATIEPYSVLTPNTSPVPIKPYAPVNVPFRSLTMMYCPSADDTPRGGLAAADVVHTDVVTVPV